MNNEEARRILDAVRKSDYPPTNNIVLSEAQTMFAKAGENKPAACIAQWIFQNEGGYVSIDDWRKVCEID